MASPINEDDEPGFLRRNLVMLILGGLVLAVGGYLAANRTPSKSTPKKKMEMVMISIPPTPPPPPPPPPPQKKEPEPEPEKEEMVAQEEVKPDEQKPDDKPLDKPADEPLGTALGGGDGNGLGLGGGSGGGMIGGGGGGKGGSRWGWYAGQVQNRIADALRSHPLTRKAGFSNVVKVWSDAAGRITRVKLSSSTGDKAVDAAIENEVLRGLVLNEPPPSDLPMPISLRLSARKPN